MDDNFIYACCTGNLDHVAIFLTNIDSRHRIIGIHRASEHGYPNIAKFILSNPKTDPTFSNNLSLYWAVRHNHKWLVELLLQDPRVVENGLDEAIAVATRENRDDILALLQYCPGGKKYELSRTKVATCHQQFWQ